MKVILCTDLYPDENVRSARGQTMAIKELVTDAARYGLELTCVIRFYTVITRKGVVLKKRRQYVDGVEIHNVPILGFRHFFLKFPMSGMVHKVLIQKNYDLIVSHMAMNFYRLQRSATKISFKHVLVVHSGDLKNKALSRCLDAASNILFRSKHLEEKVLSQFPHVKSGGVVYSGLREEFFSDYPLHNSSYDENKTNLKMVYCGALISLKNIDVVIYAIDVLLKLGRDVELDVIGNGVEMGRLKSLVSNLGLNQKVRFHGWQDQSYVISTLRQADMFVMPSKPETFGLAYLEAMASGCVVIGHKKEGIDGVVIDGYNGFLVDEATPESVSSKIEAYLNLGPMEKQDMLSAIQKTVERYTSAAASKNYYELVGENKIGN